MLPRAVQAKNARGNACCRNPGQLVTRCQQRRGRDNCLELDEHVEQAHFGRIRQRHTMSTIAIISPLLQRSPVSSVTARAPPSAAIRVRKAAAGKSRAFCTSLKGLQLVTLLPAECCRVLQRVAVCCSVLQCVSHSCRHSVAGCCSVLQCVAACCSVCHTLAGTVLQGVAACCSVCHTLAGTVFQGVAACCSVLQRVAVCVTLLPAETRKCAH